MAYRKGELSKGIIDSGLPHQVALRGNKSTGANWVPDPDIELALRRVRDNVVKATRNKQELFKYGSLGGAEIALVLTKEPQRHRVLLSITTWR